MSPRFCASSLHFAVAAAYYGVATTGAAVGDPLDRCNVVWTTPSKDSSGSMPLGNGDIGLNVWVEESGDLCFYLGKSDAWDENGRLVKLGRVRIQLSPNPLRAGADFRQTLRLRQGEVEIRGHSAGPNALVRVWVDAGAPVVHVDMTDDVEFSVSAALELWRTRARPLQGAELASAYGMEGAPHPVMAMPDTIVDTANLTTSAPATSTAGSAARARARGSLIWYHRNPFSIWAETLKLQGMESWLAQGRDPLVNRTFGAMMSGGGFEPASPTQLRSVRAAREQRLSIHVLTAQTPTPESYIDQLLELAARHDAVPADQARGGHLAWWDQFWNRSWIRVPPETPPPASAPADSTSAGQWETAATGYTLQRFITACAGRGRYPIKFNGSLFTVDAREQGETFDADYRRWGGPYWFQNTRLMYWPMPGAGDLEMMQPLIRMYADAMPFLKARTRVYFDHEGAFFPETMYFWGAYANSNYGWDRTGKPPRDVDNTFIRWHYNGTLEWLALMLDYYAFTQDEGFAARTLLPMADEILLFWAKHFPRLPGGQIEMKPAQALETYQNCLNPAPDIAGLRWVIPRLLELPPMMVGLPRRERWGQLLKDLPELPMANVGGQHRLTAAQTIIGGQGNVENPELYSIFPFRMFGVGRPGLELARQTFAARRVKEDKCWHQDDTQAAMLGLTQEAQRIVLSRFARKHPGSRFPAFYGPANDWVPDQDHGANGMMALQCMLLQHEGRKIHLMPAWPREWDVDFRLHAPLRTVVEGEYRGGRLVRLVVDPPARRGDVVVPADVAMPSTSTAP